VKIITYALIPLILSIGIIPAIPFTAGVEYSQICIDKVWIEKNSSGKIACVTSSTADKLVERGWGTILSDDVLDEPSENIPFQLPEYPDIPDVNPGLLAHNKKLAAINNEVDYLNSPEVVKVTDQVYLAIGFGLGSITMVIGDDGLIIIDTSDSYQVGKKVMSEFREITDLPVKAIVYTHHHIDHVYGTTAFVEESNGDVEIYAHDNLMERLSEENGELATATAFRGIYWAGAMLPSEGPDRLVNAGIATPIDIGGTTGFLPPTVTFDDKLEVDVAGLKMVLIHTPSETSNEIVVWFPELQVLQGAEVLYELWPNLYSIRGTQYRDVKAWIVSLETMRELQAEYMVLSHTYPVIGKENVNGVLTTYHDAVQYIYDQTIRGINKGMTPNELVQTIKLPDSLLNSPYSDWLQERYGEREWHIKGIYYGNQGWYNNDVMNLHPIPFEEKSAKIVEGFGGVKKTLQAVRTAIDDKEYTWALELATYVMYAEPDNEEAKLLKAFTSRILGHQAHTATSRNMYLTTAYVLEGKIIIDPSLVAINDPSQVKITPISQLLSLLPAKLDPQKAVGIDRVVGLYFTDVDEGYTLHIRNSIAAFKDVLPENPDVLMTTDTDTFKKAIIGEQSISDSLELNEIQIDGNPDDFIEVLNMFDPYTT